MKVLDGTQCVLQTRGGVVVGRFTSELECDAWLQDWIARGRIEPVANPPRRRTRGSISPQGKRVGPGYCSLCGRPAMGNSSLCYGCNNE